MTMALASWQCSLGDNEWCSADDPCFTCADRAHAQRHPRAVDDCRECKLRTLQIGPQVGIDTRGRKFAPIGPKGDNSWERGIVKDGRGVPLVGSDGHYVTVKEHAENRHKIEAARRRTRHEAQVLQSTVST